MPERVYVGPGELMVLLMCGDLYRANEAWECVQDLCDTEEAHVPVSLKPLDSRALPFLGIGDVVLCTVLCVDNH